MAKVNVTLSLSSTDLFAKQTLSFTETDALAPAGDQQVVGRIVTTGAGTKDNLVMKALDGTNDRAYLYMKNLSVTTGEYVKVNLVATHGTDSSPRFAAQRIDAHGQRLRRCWPARLHSFW